MYALFKIMIHYACHSVAPFNQKTSVLYSFHSMGSDWREHERLEWDHILFLISRWLHTCVVFPPRRKTEISRNPIGFLLFGPSLSFQSVQFSPSCIISLMISFFPFSPFCLPRLQLVRCWNSWIGPLCCFCLCLPFSPFCVCTCMHQHAREILNFSFQDLCWKLFFFLKFLISVPTF